MTTNEIDVDYSIRRGDRWACCKGIHPVRVIGLVADGIDRGYVVYRWENGIVEVATVADFLRQFSPAPYRATVGEKVDYAHSPHDVLAVFEHRGAQGVVLADYMGLRPFVASASECRPWVDEGGDEPEGSDA